MTKEFKRNKKNEEEKKLEAILEELYPGLFRYMGDEKVSVGGYSPDFIDDKGKRIVEFLGCFWHSCPICNYNTKEDQDKEARGLRIKAAMYRMNGYTSLNIWEHEMKHPILVANRIRNFIDNGVNK